MNENGLSTDDRRKIAQTQALEALATYERPDDPSADWWWLSFVDDDTFLGVAVVQAPDYISAIMASHLLRINPGGEVAATDIPASEMFRIPLDMRNRLLSKEEALSTDDYDSQEG